MGRRSWRGWTSLPAYGRYAIREPIQRTCHPERSEAPQRVAKRRIQAIPDARLSQHPSGLSLGWKGDLRPDECRKVQCGERHFKGALGVEYRVVTKASELP